jgi:hypothetical protein
MPHARTCCPSCSPGHDERLYEQEGTRTVGSDRHAPVVSLAGGCTGETARFQCGCAGEERTNQVPARLKEG